MKVGLVCPYTWDVPGGVQAHVDDLAQALIARGHDVSVLAPADDDDALPPYVVSTGRAVPVPYNGSVARLTFGPVSTVRVRRWLREGRFDVLHIHEPLAPSVSILALWSARGPVVATFHAARERSRALITFEPALQPALEKIHARIAVSPAARDYVVQHLGGSAVLIPNGVTVSRFRGAQPLPGWPGKGGAIGFLGRWDEPRKGLSVLLAAFGRLATTRPELRLLLAGPGDPEELAEQLDPAWADRVHALGRIDEADKARFFASLDVYCAPNTGGESFGIVLLEAMAGGAPVVASELDAFRRVVGDAGVLVPPEDPTALADALAALLDAPARRTALRKKGTKLVARYDWDSVVGEVLDVYAMVQPGRG